MKNAVGMDSFHRGRHDDVMNVDSFISGGDSERWWCTCRLDGDARHAMRLLQDAANGKFCFVDGDGKEVLALASRGFIVVALTRARRRPLCLFVSFVHFWI